MTRKIRSIIYFSLAVLLYGQRAHADVQASVLVEADTYVSAAKSTENYGSLGAMQVSGSSLGVRIALMTFDISEILAAFDAEYGAGNWTVTSVELNLGTNYGVDGQQPNNQRFSPISDGDFYIGLMADDSWDELTITYETYTSTYASMDDIILGEYYWAADGAGEDVYDTYDLGLSAALLAEIMGSTSDGKVSLYLTAADDEVCYLFNSQKFGTEANRPTLTITAAAVPEPGQYALALALPVVLATLRRRGQPWGKKKRSGSES